MKNSKQYLGEIVPIISGKETVGYQLRLGGRHMQDFPSSIEARSYSIRNGLPLSISEYYDNAAHYKAKSLPPLVLPPYLPLDKAREDELALRYIRQRDNS